MAQRVGAEGLVIAIEPHPTAAALLRRSVNANGFQDRVAMEHLAVSRSGVAETSLFLYQESELASTVVTSPQHIRVPATCLDELAAKHRVPGIKLAKIDVERAEYEVLAGAETLLREAAIDHIFIELVAQQEAHRLLRSHGYTGFLVLEHPPALVPEDRVSSGRFGDYLFVSPSRIREGVPAPCVSEMPEAKASRRSPRRRVGL
jgi:FkbM family methyltransferase